MSCLCVRLTLSYLCVQLIGCIAYALQCVYLCVQLIGGCIAYALIPFKYSVSRSFLEQRERLLSALVNGVVVRIWKIDSTSFCIKHWGVFLSGPNGQVLHAELFWHSFRGTFWKLAEAASYSLLLPIFKPWIGNSNNFYLASFVEN